MFFTVNNTLNNNTATENVLVGFSLYYSDFVTLTENTAENNNNGFRLFSSDSATLTKNKATENNNNRYYLQHSDYVTITENTATENKNKGNSLKHHHYETSKDLKSSQQADIRIKIDNDIPMTGEWGVVIAECLSITE